MRNGALATSWNKKSFLYFILFQLKFVLFYVTIFYGFSFS